MSTKQVSPSASLPSQQRRKADIQQMFAGIASRYDCANHFLSGGIDYYWRRALVSQVKRCNPTQLVDLATGSGDIALALRKTLPDTCNITGIDFCQPMLAEAERKQRLRNIHPLIRFIEGDCLNLELPDASTDTLTIGFGFRNLEDRAAGLREMQRILRPGGSLFILEFSQPGKWIRPIYYAYLKYVLPGIARLVTGKPNAYHYLCGSIASFPDRQALSQLIRANGFSKVTAKPLTFGTVAIHHAVK